MTCSIHCIQPGFFANRNIPKKDNSYKQIPEGRAANAPDFIVKLPIFDPFYDCTIIVVNFTIFTLAVYLTYYANFSASHFHWRHIAL